MSKIWAKEAYVPREPIDLKSMDQTPAICPRVFFDYAKDPKYSGLLHKVKKDCRRVRRYWGAYRNRT